MISVCLWVCACACERVCARVSVCEWTCIRPCENKKRHIESKHAQKRASNTLKRKSPVGARRTSLMFSPPPFLLQTVPDIRVSRSCSACSFARFSSTTLRISPDFAEVRSLSFCFNFPQASTMPFCAVLRLFLCLDSDLVICVCKSRSRRAHSSNIWQASGLQGFACSVCSPTTGCPALPAALLKRTKTLCRPTARECDVSRRAEQVRTRWRVVTLPPRLRRSCSATSLSSSPEMAEIMVPGVTTTPSTVSMMSPT